MIRRLALTLLLFLISLVPLRAEPLVIFAAASLKGPLDEIADNWQRDTGNEIAISFGSSATLSRQISQGAPADVFFSANSTWMKTLEDQSLITPPRDILSNTLVFVSSTPGTLPLTPEALTTWLSGGRMAIGQTRAVPVGIYGRAALETLDLWTTLSLHLAETDNTRAALALASRGEVPLALVYLSDARAAPDLHIVATIPATALPEIRYPVAAVLEGDQPTAQSFITALTTPTAAAIFKAAGFVTIDAPDD